LSSQWCLSFGLSHQNLIKFYLLSHACRMPRPPHSPSLDLPNDIWWWVQIMKFLIVQLPPFPRHLIPLRSKYSSQNLLSNTLSLCSSVSVRDQVSHPYITSGRIMVFYILTFTFLDSRRDDKRLWTEWKQAFPEFSILLISSWIQFWSDNTKFFNYKHITINLPTAHQHSVPPFLI
jgi:hypothetical protein